MGVEFAKRGADVVLVSRSEEKLKLALQNVEVSLLLTGSKWEAGRVSPEQKFSYFSADLSHAEQAQKAIISCERVPDIVFCCAGKTR
jgi:NAD(P)-dependent dehydrogenase (short-subunit alcohol dehydrogenase family)